jgi:hypothetical protein
VKFKHIKASSLEASTKKIGTKKMTASIRNRATTGRIMALGLLLVAACLLLAARPAHAATFAVDRNDDPDPTTANACTAAPNDCSLRGAIVAANAADGPDDITLPADDYALTRAGADEDAASTGDLDVTGDLTLTGAGARTTSVAGAVRRPDLRHQVGYNRDHNRRQTDRQWRRRRLQPGRPDARRGGRQQKHRRRCWRHLC